MSELKERYIQDGIWTMESPRQSCVVPEQPLFIDQAEEMDLNRLALSTWNAFESLLAVIQDASSEPWLRYKSLGKAFTEGLSMPPAIRIDTVLTNEGPRIIEIDPITAISLGETLSLINIWQERGFMVPDGLLQAIVSGIEDRGGELALSIPSEKKLYLSELTYLSDSLAARGIAMYNQAPLELSAFLDVPGNKRRVNREGWRRPLNPLWGSLVGLSDKTNLELLKCGDKVVYPSYLPETYQREDLGELDPQQIIVAKPIRGTGSRGVSAVSIIEALTLPSGYVFQEKLAPRIDTFTVEQDNNEQSYVSRVSIYAGRYGLLGAQVTARPIQPLFTNVHGQADAIQTTLSVITKESEQL